MYTTYFGLTEPPFAITPDPRYLYMSEGHREALAHLVFGIGEGGGFVLLTGEVGTGKTTLCRCLLDQLPPHVDVALILNPRLTSVELLATVCDELKVAYPAGTTSLKTLVDVLYRHLLETHERGRATVLIIDEAQDLTAGVLEEVRLLTNLETTTHKLLQVILIGQPELRGNLERVRLRQVAQRITARYHLAALSRAETEAYIRHRLEVAGGSHSLFGRTATQQVHRLSGGVPRLINVICDRALLGAYVQGRRQVNVMTVRRAAMEVLGEQHGVRWRPLATAAKVAALVAVGVIAAAAGVLITERGPLVELAGFYDRPQAVPSSALSPNPGSPPSGDTVGQDRKQKGSAPIMAGLLADPSLPTDERSALGLLYRHWRPEFRDGGRQLACSGGRLRELGCLIKVGTWKTVRRLNLPAVLALIPRDGRTRYVTVTALEGDNARLALEGRTMSVPIAEIDRYWDGRFIVLWRMPPSGARTIGPGTVGRGVEWLREQIEAIDGAPERATTRNLYDDDLVERVRAFQRDHELVPDGIVGVETLIQLSLASDPGIPTLVAAP